MMKSKFSWDQYFMTMAYLVASKSKDPSTKVGAVIIGPDHEIRSTGYNGLPRGLEDTLSRYDRPIKYSIVNHAEENAILHCSRVGISAHGCTMYVPWSPCSLCAKAIIQAGIKRVVYHGRWPGNDNPNSDWVESIRLAQEMFKETGVELVNYEGELISLKGFYQGKEVELY
jgi:dCMP deaminase